MKEALYKYWAELKEDVNCLSTGYQAKRQSKSRLNKQTEDLSFLDFLPYCTFNPKYGVFENEKTIGFALRVSHLSCMNEALKQALNNIITNDLPSDYTMQVINYASPRIGNLLDYWYESGTRSDIFKFIADNRREFFQQGAWNSILGKRKSLLVRNFELFLFVSTSKPLTQSGKEEAAYNLIDYQQKLVEGLKGINSDCFVLNGEELTRLLKELINPNFDLYKIQHIEHHNHISKNLASNHQVEMQKDGVLISNSEASFKNIIFEITDLPDAWRLENSIDYIGLFEEGISLPCPFYISYGFKLDSREKSERLSSKHRIIKTKQTDSKLPMFFPKMWEEMEDWNQVSKQLSAGQRLGKAVMYVVICMHDKSNERKYEQIVKDHFARLKFKIEKVNYDTLNTFVTTLPFGIGESWQMLEQLKVPFKLTSSACINLAPVFADSQNYGSPLMMFTGRRGQLFFFDNFKTAGATNGNFNMIFVGAPGTGKSVSLQEYAASILRFGGQVVILDDGRSFQNSCALLNGDFVDFGGGDFCINPFSLYQAPDNLEQADEYKEYFEDPFIDLIVSQLCIVVNVDKNDTTNPEVGLYRTVMAYAVAEVTRKKGKDGGFSDIRAELQNNKKLRGSQTLHIAQKIEYVLQSYSEDGRYAKYFNGTASLNIGNILSVFELSDLEHNQNLQTSVLLTVIFLVYSNMRSRARRTSLIIDEAWKLLAHSAIKGFIEGIARRARKYNSCLVVATQRISDFDKSKSEAAAAILAQADWIVLLSVEGRDNEILKNQLSMSDGEIEIARKLVGLKGAYSEFMLRHRTGGWQVGRLLLDKFSAKLYSTSADDVVAINTLKKQGVGVVDAINHLIAKEAA